MTRSIRELLATIDLLDAALLAQGVNFRPVPAPWLLALTRQQRALVGILWAAYPRVATREHIISMLPGNRMEETDRQPTQVDVVICSVRRKLGKGKVETIPGEGFKLSAELYASMETLPLAHAA